MGLLLYPLDQGSDLGRLLLLFTLVLEPMMASLNVGCSGRKPISKSRLFVGITHYQ